MTQTNSDQIAYWNAGPGETWAELQAQMDVQLEPLGAQAMAALAPQKHEQILDIGCGSGQTTLALAALTQGVTGVDISRPLLDLARKRGAEVANARFIEADAQTYRFEPASFDGVFSRFGVMFFADPVAAFANIRTALRPGGRVAFVCWRSPVNNPFMSLALQAAAPLLPPAPPPVPGAPGPFGFADPDRVHRVLSEAGFEGIDLAPHNEKIGNGDLEQTLSTALKIGPLGAALREHPDKRDLVLDAVREVLRPHEGPDGMKLDSATWIVRARNPNG